MPSAANYTFASDNTAGICPEALAAINAANVNTVPSYGDDPFTAEAKRCFAALFETECDVFFVFNGTAANALALAAICDRHHAIVCHELSHVDTDECSAPEFFTGGCKVIPICGPLAKLRPGDILPVFHRGHGVHFPKVRALSLTQSTELGTMYTPAEIRALCALAHERGLAVHMDGARFANATAALAAKGHSAADVTWRAGVDILSFGGTKNGLLTTEAVVCFNSELAQEFEYRVKQSGQLASKMRFAGAQWAAVLRDGAWLRHATHANRMAAKLSNALQSYGYKLIAPTEVNGVFVELPVVVVDQLTARGWHFYRFAGDNGFRLMCSWATKEAAIDAFLADVRAAR